MKKTIKAKPSLFFLYSALTYTLHILIFFEFKGALLEKRMSLR